jgi:hypothetical protein
MRTTDRDTMVVSRTTARMNKATDWNTSKVIIGTGRRPPSEPAKIIHIMLATGKPKVLRTGEQTSRKKCLRPGEHMVKSKGQLWGRCGGVILFVSFPWPEQGSDERYH